MRHYVCTIFNHNYSFDHQESVLGDASLCAKRVVRTTVRARSRSQAAAKAFVLTIGRKRARKLQELNAPEICIEFMTNYRAMAQGLIRTVNRLNTDFFLDNQVES